LFKNNSKNTYYNNKIKFDIIYINQIYDKLIKFYELPTEIKKKETKPKKLVKTDSNDEKDDEYKNDRGKNKEPDYSYLYTLVNFNDKMFRNKMDKVDTNKRELKKYEKKPIRIDGNEHIFSGYVEKSIDIIKLNNHKKYQY
jgi:hypothetical protein